MTFIKKMPNNQQMAAKKVFSSDLCARQIYASRDSRDDLRFCARYEAIKAAKKVFSEYFNCCIRSLNMGDVQNVLIVVYFGSLLCCIVIFGEIRIHSTRFQSISRYFHNTLLSISVQY